MFKIQGISVARNGEVQLPNNLSHLIVLLDDKGVWISRIMRVDGKITSVRFAANTQYEACYLPHDPDIDGSVMMIYKKRENGLGFDLLDGVVVAKLRRPRFFSDAEWDTLQETMAAAQSLKNQTIPAEKDECKRVKR